MAQLVAQRYAEALFELALEHNNMDICLEKLILLGEFFKDDEFAVVIKHPEVKADEKFNILKNCANEGTPDDVLGLVRLLADKGRVASIPAIVCEFQAMVDEHNRLLEAHVYSAASLSESQSERVKAMLQKKYGKAIKLEQHLDPTIIGGLRIQVGDDMLDTSIKKNIEDIRSSLLSL